MRVFLIVYLIIRVTYTSKTDFDFDPSPTLTIAGNKKITECISGGLQSESDLDITTTKMIQKEGYPAEEHVVLTEDGYYLTMHRIPGGPNATPVLVQHGILCSSYEWVVSGKGRALAFILADNGYDVWLGNFRGNTYSRCHNKYDTSEIEFWNFSFHEMAIYDLPAKVTYITDLTNKKILYIGHSMGTTASYIMAIERPDIATRIKAMFSLAPVVTMTHGQCALHSTLQFLHQNGLFFSVFGHGEFVPQTRAMKEIIKNLCFGSVLQNIFCMHTFFRIHGFGEPRSSYYYMMTPKIFSHFPAGTSSKTVAHYYQIRSSDNFHAYDYGSEENLRRYGRSTPPEYDVSKISLPVALFWTENDPFAHPIDVKRFSRRLPNRILDYKVELREFNHIDFTYAENAFKCVYSKLVSTMEDFS